jgi:hypothetical protein
VKEEVHPDAAAQRVHVVEEARADAWYRRCQVKGRKARRIAAMLAFDLEKSNKNTTNEEDVSGK